MSPASQRGRGKGRGSSHHSPNPPNQSSKHQPQPPTIHRPISTPAMATTFPTHPGAFGGFIPHEIPMDHRGRTLYETRSMPNMSILAPPIPQPLLSYGPANAFGTRQGPGPTIVYHQLTPDSVGHGGVDRRQNYRWPETHHPGASVAPRSPGYEPLHSRSSPAVDSYNGRDLITIPRHQWNEFIDLRKEVSSLRETVRRYVSDEESRRSSLVSEENDRIFRMHLENASPRKEQARVRERRPTFPGSGAPAVTRFDGHDKKKFNPAGSLAVTPDKITIAKRQADVLNKINTAGRADVGINPAKNLMKRGRRPTRGSADGKPETRPRNPNAPGPSTSEEGYDASRESSPQEWSAMGQSKGGLGEDTASETARPRSQERIAIRLGKLPEEVSASNSSSSSQNTDYKPPVIVDGSGSKGKRPMHSGVKGYTGPIIVDGSKRQERPREFSFNPQASDFNYANQRELNYSQSWDSAAYLGQQFNTTQNGYNCDTQPGYYPPQSSDYVFEQPPYPGMYGQQYQQPVYPPSDISGYMPEPALDEQYQHDPTFAEDEYDQFGWQIPATPSQTQYRQSLVDHADIPEIPLSVPDHAAQPESNQNQVSEGVNMPPDTFAQRQNFPLVEANVEASDIQSETYEQNTGTSEVSAQSSRIFNWADDSSDDETLVEIPAVASGEPVVITDADINWIPNSDSERESIGEANELPGTITSDQEVSAALPVEAAPQTPMDDTNSRVAAVAQHSTTVTIANILVQESTRTRALEFPITPAVPLESIPRQRTTDRKESRPAGDEEGQWQTVDRSGKAVRRAKENIPATPPRVRLNATKDTPSRPAGSTWARVASSGPVVSPKSIVAADKIKLESPAPALQTGQFFEEVKRDGRRKLYIDKIPQETTYLELMTFMRGGLIDDVYVSGLSPDQHHHHQQKIGRVKAMTGEDWFAYITFYSDKGAARCIEYLNHLDTINTGVAATTRFSVKHWVNSNSNYPDGPVTHITLHGQRMPVFFRQRDQRPLQDEIVPAVETDNATRVLLFTFRKNIRAKSSSSHMNWDTWQKEFSTDGGKSALQRMSRYLQIWKGTPTVYMESLELLPVEAVIESPKKPLTTPKLFLGPPDNQTYRVRVSLLRISVALKVRRFLEQDLMFRDHCCVTFAPDPCVERPPIDHEDSESPQTPTKCRKKKRKGKPDTITDVEVFPPLPGSAMKDCKSPVPPAVWINKDASLGGKLDDTESTRQHSDAEGSKSMSRRSSSDLDDSADTATESARRNKKWVKVEL